MLLNESSINLPLALGDGSLIIFWTLSVAGVLAMMNRDTWCPTEPWPSYTPNNAPHVPPSFDMSGITINESCAKQHRTTTTRKIPNYDECFKLSSTNTRA